MDRVPVPPKLRKSLLKKNANACCVCKARNVGINFHHIDNNRANTVEANLAVLCVRDHDAHHRPAAYRPDALVNHMDLSREAILSKKVAWEAFVEEARKPSPAVLATLAMYGTDDALHAAQVAFQWADGGDRSSLVFTRTYHLLDGPPSAWVESIWSDVAWLGTRIKLVVLDAALPVDHCTCCGTGLTRTVPPGSGRRLTSPTWSSSSVCSIYINPKHARITMRIEDEHGLAFLAHIHRCGAYLDVATQTYHEQLPIAPLASVRAQATRIVKKLLSDWKPGHTIFGSGASDNPTFVDGLRLPRCWERGERPRRSP